MSRIMLLTKAALLFGLLGAVIAAFAYYVLEYWGSPSSMVQAIFDPQAMNLALPVLANTLLLAFCLALPASLVAGLAISVFLVLAAQHVTRGHTLVVVVLGAVIGSIIPAVMYGWWPELSSPVFVGAIAGSLTALLLSRKLRRWFSPRALIH